MKFRTRVLLLTLLGLFTIGVTAFVVGGIVLLDVLFDPTPREVYPHERASAERAVQVWGRLEPFPTTAQEVKYMIAGSDFTRCYDATFIAPPEDIEEWLKSSPGTRETTPTIPAPGVRLFKITPGGGGNVAELTVDDNEHRVRVRVEWS
jgi:hypothetical protein